MGSGTVPLITHAMSPIPSPPKLIKMHSLKYIHILQVEKRIDYKVDFDVESGNIADIQK